MKKKTDSIQISDDLEIPVASLLSRKVAGMGTNGSGKTYAMMKIVESILRKHGWVIIFDPVGVWYGLRLDKSGRKSSDIQIPIFGGEHGDMPLPSEAGKLIADLLFDKRLSAILDVSEFTDSELNRFCADFAERFLARMRTRKSAVSIVMDECQQIIPQFPQKGEEKKLHHFTKLGLVGRNHGVGFMMISPRPQEVSKRILNMSQLMFGFQMSGAHERAAMRDWFKHAGYKEPLDEILPTLEVGKPFVSSPAWLKINRVIGRIHPKTTFDSSATPEFDGDAVQTIALSPLDMDSIKEQMAGIIAQAKADDPKALRNEITQLKREVLRLEHERANIKPPTPPDPVIRFVDKPILTDEQIAALVEAAERIQIASNQWGAAINTIADGRDDLRNIAANVLSAVQQGKMIAAGWDKAKAGAERSVRTNPVRPAIQPRPQAPVKSSNGDLSGPQQRIIDAIAWMETAGIFLPRRSVIAALSGYSVKSTSFKNPVSDLKRNGLIEYPDSQSLCLTDEGRARANPQPSPANTAELHEIIFRKITGAQARILKPLIDAYPDPLDREALAELAGYSAKSTSFKNPLSDLKGFGFVGYPNSQSAIALPILFIDGDK